MRTTPMHAGASCAFDRSALPPLYGFGSFYTPGKNALARAEVFDTQTPPTRREIIVGYKFYGLSK